MQTLQQSCLGPASPLRPTSLVFWPLKTYSRSINFPLQWQRDAQVDLCSVKAAPPKLSVEDATEPFLEGEDAILDNNFADTDMPSLLEEESDVGSTELDFEGDRRESSTQAEAMEEPAALVDIDKVSWGQTALDIARKVLQTKELDGVELYSFQALAKGGGLDIRLDKMDDKYGSPSMDDIALFARAFYRELELALGEDEAGAITLEVSSPGANRSLHIPQDLHRFKYLPMSVTYRPEEVDEKISNRVLALTEIKEDVGLSVWGLADVRINRTNTKSMKLTKKQAAQRFQIPLPNLQDVKLYVDF